MTTAITARYAGTRRTRPATDPARLSAELAETSARIAAHRRKRTARAVQGLQIISTSTTSTWSTK